jgi:hypothetical protein
LKEEKNNIENEKEELRQKELAEKRKFLQDRVDKFASV